MNCNTPSLQIELDVGDIVSGVDRLRDDIPLQQSSAVDVAAVRVSDHHPGKGRGTLIGCIRYILTTVVSSVEWIHATYLTLFRKLWHL